MAEEEEEGEVEAVEVEAEEEVSKGVGAIRSLVVPTALHSTEFVLLSKCSSVWLFSVNVLLFPTKVGVGACVHIHVSLYYAATSVVARPLRRVHGCALSGVLALCYMLLCFVM